jgi:transposase
MVQLTLFPDDAPGPRWISPPWTTASDRWQEIDRDLPDDHPVRRIAEIVSELDLTPLIASYAGLGSPAHPPELLVRLALFEIHRACLSPAQWFEDCRYDDAVKWLIFGLRPSRTCLYQFRDRLGPYLDSWNRSVLRTAQAEGWTPAKRASVDGTFAASYASRHTPIKAKSLAQRCQQLDAAVAADFSPPTENPPAPAPAAEVPLPVEDRSSQPEGVSVPTPAVVPTPAPIAAAAPPALASPASEPAPPATPAEPPAWMAKTPEGRFRQRQRYRCAQETMEKRQKQQKQTQSRRAKAKRRSPEQAKISLSDPDAPLGFDKTKVFRPLFNIQFACDLDSPFVLGYDVFAAVSDANLLGPTLKRTKTLCGPTLEVVLNEGSYANILNLKLCDEMEITMYAPLPKTPAQRAGTVASSAAPGECGGESNGPAPRVRLIPKSEFTWLPEERTYRCPAGHQLVLQRRGTESRADGELVELQYRCPAEHCQACPLANQCTRTPQQGRIVKRSEHDERYDDLRQRMSQPEGQAIYQLRKQTVERQFADLKHHRGLRQFASFGLKRARIQVGLLVLAHNGLELLKARSRGAEAETKPKQVG